MLRKEWKDNTTYQVDSKARSSTSLERLHSMSGSSSLKNLSQAFLDLQSEKERVRERD